MGYKIFFFVLFLFLNFCGRRILAHLFPALPAAATSTHQPPDVFIGLRSLLRWWNFLGFPAWKRSIQLISGCKQPNLTAPRDTHPTPPIPSPTRGRSGTRRALLDASTFEPCSCQKESVRGSEAGCAGQRERETERPTRTHTWSAGASSSPSSFHSRTGDCGGEFGILRQFAQLPDTK